MHPLQMLLDGLHVIRFTGHWRQRTSRNRKVWIFHYVYYFSVGHAHVREVPLYFWILVMRKLWIFFRHFLTSFHKLSNIHRDFRGGNLYFLLILFTKFCNLQVIRETCLNCWSFPMFRNKCRQIPKYFCTIFCITNVCVHLHITCYE